MRDVATITGSATATIHAAIRNLRCGIAEVSRSTSPAYTAIDAKQSAWVNRLSDGIPRSELETAARVLDEISSRLEAEAEKDKNETPARAR